MDDTFLSHLQRLELIAFFAGYPLLYLVISAVSEGKILNDRLKSTLTSLLPYSYALVGTLYLGLQLRTYYFAITDNQQFRLSLLVIWGLLANLFWIRFLAKKPGLSLLHGLIFFFPVVEDIFIFITKHGVDRDIVLNDMKLYTISLVIHIASFLSVLLMYFLYRSFRIKE